MKLRELLPDVYFKESRDFAYIARLIELPLNYIKTNVDEMNVSYIDPNMDSSMLDLLASTLGFKSKHKYNNKDLIYIVSSLSELLQNKGNLKSIETAIQLLLTSQGIKKAFELTFSENVPYLLEITLPDDLTDTILLEDLFDYILPAGLIYRIIKRTIIDDLVTENDIIQDVGSDTPLDVITNKTVNAEDHKTTFETIVPNQNTHKKKE